MTKQAGTSGWAHTWARVRNMVGQTWHKSADGPVGRTAQGAYGATVDGLKGLGDGSLKKTAETFNEARPFLERAGFHVSQIEMGMGLSPRVTSQLSVVKRLNEEEQRNLLLEVRERTIIRTVLASLFRAMKTSDGLTFDGFSLCELELEISLLPTVVVKFRPDPEDRRSDQAEPMLIDNACHKSDDE